MVFWLCAVVSGAPVFTVEAKVRNGPTRCYAVVLLLALVAGLQFLAPSGHDFVDGPAATASTNASYQPGAAPRPHNDTAAHVPHTQLPADAPSISGMSTSLRVLIAAAKRMRRTPDEGRSRHHSTRAPPHLSRS